MARFGTGRLDNLIEELKEMKQKGTIEEYIEDFELYSSQCGRLLEQQFLGYFIVGLRNDIRKKIRTLKQNNRYQAMQMARDIEGELCSEEEDDGHVRSKLGGLGLNFRQPKYASGGRFISGQGGGLVLAQNATSSYHSQNGASPYSYSTRFGGSCSNSSSGSKNTSVSTAGSVFPTSGRNPSSSSQLMARRQGMERKLTMGKDRGLKHIPYAELLERKAKGLCFRCGEKYNPLHRCANTQLRLLVVGDDETITDGGEVAAAEEDDDPNENPLECQTMGLCASMGEEVNTGPRTMKLIGTIGGIPLVILIDSGATHNFISSNVVSMLVLNVNGKQRMRVKFGDSHKIQTQGKCSGVKVQLDRMDYDVEAYVMELGNIDLILGVIWLKTLGLVVMDWDKMTISFKKNGEEIKLQCTMGCPKIKP